MLLRTFCLLLALTMPVMASSLETHSSNLSNLIDPLKLATLGKRGANPRIQKAVAILEDARRDGYDVPTVASNAVFIAGYTNFIIVTLTRDSLTRNHGIAEKLGVLNDTGLDLMRRGRSPTVQNGPYRNDDLTVDHIVPVAVAPELDKVIANLELMPRRMNSAKGAKLGSRQYDYAKRFRAAGLLTAKRLDQILNQ